MSDDTQRASDIVDKATDTAADVRHRARDAAQAVLSVAELRARALLETERPQIPFEDMMRRELSALNVNMELLIVKNNKLEREISDLRYAPIIAWTIIIAIGGALLSLMLLVAAAIIPKVMTLFAK